MSNDEIIQYYDHLIRLATSKCGSQSDAEDLVGDTMLAALAYIHRGGIIEHPKAWLTNTLCHKHNDNLRKKYRAPVTVCLDESVEIAQQEDEEYFTSEEASRVRRELNHLGFITREALIRYYFGNQSVSDIAKGLGIPEGTVKSRLSAGRGQMKKGLENMETKENYLPGKMWITFGGAEGLNGEPMSLVEGDLIAQNLLMLAYDKPKTVSELSRSIGIPAAYIEPIIKKLTEGELMVMTDGGKIYTDFLITKPQNRLKNFKPQLDFAHKHFDAIWSVIEKMSERISQMPFVADMEEGKRVRLDRYAVLKALQDFQYFGTGKVKAPDFPMRKDGGRWCAHATAIDAGYDMKQYNESSNYIIHGGHRTSETVGLGRAKRVRFYEFDTPLWDATRRFYGAYELYFKHITDLLWYIYDGVSVEDTDIPNEFIAYMPKLEEFGLIGHTEGKPCLKIPVLKDGEYHSLIAAVNDAVGELQSKLGKELSHFVSTMKTPVPGHLTSVPELFRYADATNYLVMATVREAYSKGLHLKGINYCCPPVVLTYEE